MQMLNKRFGWSSSVAFAWAAVSWINCLAGARELPLHRRASCLLLLFWFRYSLYATHATAAASVFYRNTTCMRCHKGTERQHAFEDMANANRGQIPFIFLSFSWMKQSKDRLRYFRVHAVTRSLLDGSPVFHANLSFDKSTNRSTQLRANQEADLNESFCFVALVEKNFRTVTFWLIFHRNHLNKKKHIVHVPDSVLVRYSYPSTIPISVSFSLGWKQIKNSKIDW